MIIPTAYIIIFLILLGLFLPSLTFAPWVPARKKDLKRIFRLAELKAGDVFYDLGCGDGKVVLYAAEHANVNAKGIELAFPMYVICQIRKLFTKNNNASFIFGNLFKENFSDADVVYVWGMPDTLKGKFKAKIEKEMKKGSKLISYAFKIHGFEPVLIDKPHKDDVSIYVYEF